MISLFSKLCFLLNVSKLIERAYKKGYQPIGYEHLDFKERQKKYHCKLLSRIIRSRHQSKLRFDLELSFKGKPVTSVKEFKLLTEYWKSLGTKYYSGKDCGKKPNHFGMEFKKPRRTKRRLPAVDVRIQIF
jgi:hypothetical protein